MTDDWPISVGRERYHPIPESWIDCGHDQGADGTRIFAVSVAAVPDSRDVLAIRYVHPHSGQTLRVRTPGRPNPTGDGLVPASLATMQDWPRSRIADADPTGSAREVEMERLRELWHERVDAIPAPDEDELELVTDGGRDVTATHGGEHCGLDHDAVEDQGLDLCPVCGELTVSDVESKLSARIVPDLLPPLSADDGGESA